MKLLMYCEIIANILVAGMMTMISIVILRSIYNAMSILFVENIIMIISYYSIIACIIGYTVWFIYKKIKSEGDQNGTNKVEVIYDNSSSNISPNNSRTVSMDSLIRDN